MSALTRPYTDGDGTSRDHQIDSRSVGGTAGDVYKTQETGGQMDFGGASTGNLMSAGASGVVSAEQSCDGFESILLKLETSKSSPNVEIRVWRAGANATKGWVRGEKLTVPTSNVNNNSDFPSLATGFFHAGLVVIPTNGAKVFKVQVVTLSKGTAEVWWSTH